MSKRYTAVEREFDGFDHSDLRVPYDKKRERRFHAAIWMVLAVISLILLFNLITQHIKEIYLIQNGNCIEAAYNEKTMIAQCFDEEGKWHSYNLQGYYPVTEGANVRLYYMEDIAAAVPANTILSWLKYYGFFGLLFAVSVWRIHRVYRTVT